MAVIQRQTAYKIWIRDIVSNKVDRKEGEYEPLFITLNGKNISRVNIMANIISIFKTEDNNYNSMTIEDGSASILVKAWKEDTKMFDDLKIGDIVNIVGRIKQYAGVVYLLPELIKIIESPTWELLRKAELIKENGTPKHEEIILVKEAPKPEITEEVIEEPTTQTRQSIIALIERLDVEDGASIDEIVTQFDDETSTKSIISELIKEGEIFENKQGKLKLIS